MAQFWCGVRPTRRPRGSCGGLLGRAGDGRTVGKSSVKNDYLGSMLKWLITDRCSKETISRFRRRRQAADAVPNTPATDGPVRVPVPPGPDVPVERPLATGRDGHLDRAADRAQRVQSRISVVVLQVVQPNTSSLLSPNTRANCALTMSPQSRHRFVLIASGSRVYVAGHMIARSGEWVIVMVDLPARSADQSSRKPPRSDRVGRSNAGLRPGATGSPPTTSASPDRPGGKR